jgi:hypothetical protein
MPVPSMPVPSSLDYARLWLSSNIPKGFGNFFPKGGKGGAARGAAANKAKGGAGKAGGKAGKDGASKAGAGGDKQQGQSMEDLFKSLKDSGNKMSGGGGGGGAGGKGGPGGAGDPKNVKPEMQQLLVTGGVAAFLLYTLFGKGGEMRGHEINWQEFKSQLLRSGQVRGGGGGGGGESKEARERRAEESVEETHRRGGGHSNDIYFPLLPPPSSLRPPSSFLISSSPSFSHAQVERLVVINKNIVRVVLSADASSFNASSLGGLPGATGSGGGGGSMGGGSSSDSDRFYEPEGDVSDSSGAENDRWSSANAATPSGGGGYSGPTVGAQPRGVSPYYFYIGSLEGFERKLEIAQRELGIGTNDFVPVQYV